jgi:hypothetical protein
MNNPFKQHPAAYSIWALSLLALSGCGGQAGGTVGSPVPPTVPAVPVAFSAADLQGRWATTGTASPPGFGLIVLPAQDSAATAWLLAQDASSLSRLLVTGGSAYTVAGKTYSFNASGAQAVSAVSASGSAVLTSSPKTLALNGLGQTPLALLQSDPLSAPAAQADLAGNWRASVSQGAQAINWRVDAAGAVSGTSTTSCTWQGSLVALPNATAYRASLTEICPSSTVQFSGLATLNPAKTQFTAVATSGDDAKGIVLFMARL